MLTEVVYVCTGNFKRYLYLSLRTLLASGSHFDRVRVYVVSENQPDWVLEDDRIVVEAVPDISAQGEWGSYWGSNKVHLCRSDADRVIYLDTDVMVLKSLELTFSGVSEDLIARYGVETYRKRFWSPEVWSTVCRNAGSPDFPFYSPGFMVFQNGSHKRIEGYWLDTIERILRREIPPLVPNKHAEMYAFSLAAGLAGLSDKAMPESHHRYAMIGEEWQDAVVYHLGTPGFYRHYLPIEKDIGLKKRKDISVDRPLFTQSHAYFVRARYRIKRMLSNKRREAGLEY